MPLALEHLPADILDLGPTARAALAGRPRPFGADGLCVPAGVHDVPRPAPVLERSERRALVDSLRRSLAVHGPHVRVLDSLRHLEHEGAALVLAGQQPGFLGGPLFNLWKTLHAVALARALEREWGTPVVPAFWNHADDHDVAEVHHLWVMNPALDLRKVALASMSSGKEPLSRLVLSEERHRLGAIAELLRQTLWEGPEREGALEAFLPRAGESLASAFTRTWLDLFGSFGVLVIEPDAIRAQLSRALAQIVGADPLEALLDGERRLADQGLPPSIESRGAALVFRSVAGKRQALRASEDGFRFDAEPGSRSAAELALEIQQEPDAYSPGALLRPLAQDLALPVSAYIGGFGELAYQASLAPLRRRVRAPDTAFVPRLSATLVDPETDAALAKLGCSVRDALLARGHLGLGDADAAAPEIVAKLRARAQRAAAELVELRPELAQLDRGLSVQLKKVAEQAQGLVEKLAEKAQRVHDNSTGKERRHARRANNGLFPRGAPQERVRGALEFCARFGRGWIDDLAPEIDPFPTEHVVVHLS